MKTFKQFIIEANEAAADNLEQRREVSKDKSRTAAKDFRDKSKNRVEQQKQKHAQMRADYEAAVEKTRLSRQK